MFDQVMAQLRSAVDQLAGCPVGGLTDAGLAEELVGLRRVVDALEAVWLGRLAEFDARDAAAASGLGTAGWLRASCRLSPGAAGDRVRTARELASLPATAAALGEGEISLAHAGLVAHAVHELRAIAGPATASAVEAPLLEVARIVDPLRLRREIAHARHALAPELAATAAGAAHARRRLSVSETFDGLVAVDGVLDPEGGAVLLSALAPLAAPAGPDDARTPAQRRADALVELSRRALDSGALPAVNGERPHLTVTVELATLRRLPGARAASSGWAGPLIGEAARRIACDAAITRVITDGPSQPLDVGRRTRTIPSAIRTALSIRDRGCVFPGCDRPPGWTDAHHIHHWADGGVTALDNLVLLCRRHHRTVHEGRWQLQRGADCRWTVQPAVNRNGLALGSPPHRRAA